MKDARRPDTHETEQYSRDSALFQLAVQRLVGSWLRGPTTGPGIRYSTVQSSYFPYDMDTYCMALQTPPLITVKSHQDWQWRIAFGGARRDAVGSFMLVETLGWEF